MDWKKISISIFIIFISVLGILLSNNPSTYSDSFVVPSPIKEQEEGIGEGVQGAYVSSFPNPSPIIPEDIKEDQLDEPELGSKVIKVVDGDTVDVETEGQVSRLRLIGIDTPETVDPRKKIQCFGKEASNKAKELLLGKYVTLESDDTQGDKDKYRRLLRYIFLPDGENFNRLMIAEGYATEYTYADPYKYQAEFRAAQVEAQSQNKGLWNPATCSGQR